MQPELHPLREASLFYGVALGLALGLAALSPLLGHAVTLYTMQTPAIAVIVCRLVHTRGASVGLAGLGLTRLGMRHWPMALGLPLFGLLPGYMVVWGSGIGSFTLQDDVVWWQLAAHLMVSLIAGVFLGAMAEEIGWRGYLLPRLVPLFGPSRSGLLIGFLHGCWHLPLIFLTPFYNSEGPVAVTVPMFLVLVALAGPIFAQLRLTSGSIVPVALMHATWNTLWEFFAKTTQTSDRALVTLFAGESGIISVLMLGLIALWLARRPPVLRAIDAA